MGRVGRGCVGARVLRAAAGDALYVAAELASGTVIANNRQQPTAPAPQLVLLELEPCPRAISSASGKGEDGAVAEVAQQCPNRVLHAVLLHDLRHIDHHHVLLAIDPEAGVCSPTPCHITHT